VLTNKEKGLIHRYKRAAGIPDAEYRSLLRRHSGAASAADAELHQAQYESIMAALETVYWERLDTGHARPDPRIRARRYWRDKIVPAGRINSRQYRTICNLWQLLSDYLPEADRCTQYFSGIVRRSTGRADLGASALTSHQAGCVIDALKDRLSYAISPKGITE
jgi:hypothetical protein